MRNFFEISLRPIFKSMFEFMERRESDENFDIVRSLISCDPQPIIPICFIPSNPLSNNSYLSFQFAYHYILFVLVKI